ncbi:MAG: flagellar motor switch protein FliN [Aquifex sp.]|nr:MAG: flagellar motor switch protein FliN [Aquifex sp.]
MEEKAKEEVQETSTEKVQEEVKEELKEEKVEPVQKKENLIELIQQFSDIPVDIEVVVGRAQKTLGELLGMGIGSVIELDREVKDFVDIKVNGKLIAKGELVVVDGKIGVKIKEVVKEER